MKMKLIFVVIIPRPLKQEIYFGFRPRICLNSRKDEGHESTINRGALSEKIITKQIFKLKK